jgi:hypothetical protein
MSLSQDAQNLASLLFNLTQPDTTAIRNAEAMLKPIWKNPNSVPALFEVLAARGIQVSLKNDDESHVLISYLILFPCCVTHFHSPMLLGM